MSFPGETTWLQRLAWRAIRWLERVAGIYRTGPELPQRIVEMVAEYRAHHPRASVEAWHVFAVEYARQAWQAGYVHGYEHSERFWEWPDPAPDVLADVEAPEWRTSPPIRLDGGRYVYAEEEQEE